MNDMYETFIMINERRNFLKFYLSEASIKGYNYSELQYVKGKVELIDFLYCIISYKVLSNLLMCNSNRRLREIIVGSELISDIVKCPEDYKLVLDLDTLEESNIVNALVFTDLRQKYCYFKHKNQCKDTGLNYINNKWQSLT